MVLKKKPVRELPKPYVPPGGKKIYVGGTVPASLPGKSPSPWNWQTVATAHGLGDVWKDLIEFNFPTVAYETGFQNKCKAVNWYLEERVGCTKSNDGKNYSFEGASPGHIYVPTVVTDDVGIRAARSILKVLGSPYVSYVNFTLGGMFIHPTFFHKVGHAILDGKIAIAVNSGLHDYANYNFTTSPPTMTLRNSRLNTQGSKSSVIHEAVHTISHMKGKDRNNLLDESVAYVAQAIYYRKATSSRIVSPDSKADQVYQVADDLAQKVLTAQLLGEKDKQAIMNKVVKSYPHGKIYNYSAFPFPK